MEADVAKGELDEIEVANKVIDKEREKPNAAIKSVEDELNELEKMMA